jgi:hypothetical protein
MKALPKMVEAGRNQNDLSAGQFEKVFGRIREQMEVDGISLTSDHFSASASGEAKFRDMILRQVPV